MKNKSILRSIINKRYTDGHFLNILKSIPSLYCIRYIHISEFSSSIPVHKYLSEMNAYFYQKKKNTDKFWVALSVAPNCKDIQCPFTVEGINGGKITQWNIDLGGARRQHKWYKHVSHRHNVVQKIHKSS